MPFDPGLEIGQIITNQKIIEIFKCGNMGGIRRSTKTNTIVLVTDQTKEYYKDEWLDNGKLLYTGMGKTGDQTLNGNQNINIYESNENGIELHLFEVLERTEYTYRGIVHLVEKPYTDIQDERMVWIFPIVPERKRIYIEADKDRNRINVEMDSLLVSQELNAGSFEIRDFKNYKGEPKKKKSPKKINGYSVYIRSRETALNALAYADYKCEISYSHPTFLRKKIDIQYTEPHHLVPLEYFDQFDVSLDIEQNIVSLCSHCHNEIHYGRDRYILLEKLYNERKELLQEVGINITLEELKTMYK